MANGGKSGHLQGGKYTTSHTSIIEAAVKPVKAAEKLACVSKISLGFIKRIKSGQFRISFKEESSGCLVATIRGSSSIQEIWLYTTDPLAVKESMKAAGN